jgi:BCD family chlorophyll transporter-like MFS transporter
MSSIGARFARGWQKVNTSWLPFADAASTELPIGRLLRLALFQVSVGGAVVLLNGTLNRVMIVDLWVPASLVSIMIALPLLFAPLRALIGFRSDTYRSALGWRRVPYIWGGSLLMFGGLAIMPFALIVLSGDTTAPVWVANAAAGLAFLMVGAGLHITQTAGLALATDLAPARTRPQVVALLYVMLLVGMLASSLIFGALLQDFSQLRLIQVIQGAAVATFALNMIALWKQEPRRPYQQSAERQSFRKAWRSFSVANQPRRFLVAVALGTAGFSMQDILLEPYGGEVLGLSVSATTVLTALFAAGGLAAFALAARLLGRGADGYRLAALGSLVGVVAFSFVIFAEPLDSALLFRVGTVLIGFGGGLFAVSTLHIAMSLNAGEYRGLALGAWGAVQATAAGLGIAAGGILRDVVLAMA